MTFAKRNHILVHGRKDFELVLTHPQFQENPLATIREHLSNVVSKAQQSKEEKKDVVEFAARHQKQKKKKKGPQTRPVKGHRGKGKKPSNAK